MNMSEGNREHIYKNKKWDADDIQIRTFNVHLTADEELQIAIRNGTEAPPRWTRNSSYIF